MSRDIIFRAWDPFYEKMVTASDLGHFVEFDGDVWKNETGEPGDGTDNLKHIHDYTLMQWTGLTDKTGGGIYEGDVVEFEYEDKIRRSEVVWDDGGFCVNACSGYMPYLGEMLGNGHLVVIGNIHQNPELLEAAK